MDMEDFDFTKSISADDSNNIILIFNADDVDELEKKIPQLPSTETYIYFAWVLRPIRQDTFVDPLLTITFERVRHYFRGVPCVHFVAIADLRFDSAVFRLLLLPEKTIYVLNGNPQLYDICSLAHMRAALGFQPPIALHWDQELIESSYSAGTFSNKSTCLNSHLSHVYQQYKYVVRTYYSRQHLSHKKPLSSATVMFFNIAAKGALSAILMVV
jgi:hypothetical protein